MSGYMKILLVSLTIFVNVLTVLAVLLWHTVKTEWQPVWTGVSQNIEDVSVAVVGVGGSIKPIADTAPQMFAEAKGMNAKMGKMENSVGDMKESMSGMQKDIHLMSGDVRRLNISVYNMSHSVPQGMNSMRNQMDPMRMMNPFN